MCRYSRGYLGRGVKYQLSKDSKGHGLRPSIFRYALTYLRSICVIMAMPIHPFHSYSLAMWSTGTCIFNEINLILNEKNETCHILVPNELKNAELLTVQLGLQ